MKTTRISQLRAAQEIFEQKEALEARIDSEKQEVYACEQRLRMQNGNADPEKNDISDRGYRLGTRFSLIGFFILAFTAIGLLFSLLGGSGFHDGVLTAVVTGGVLGLPPTMVGLLLLRAYRRGRKLRTAAKQAECDHCRGDIAGSEAENGAMVVVELEYRLALLMKENAEKISFIPYRCWNAAAVKRMALFLEQGLADDLAQAAALYDRDRDKAEPAAKNMSAGVNYAVFSNVFDTVANKIFR